jgi:hypothetical protein
MSTKATAGLVAALLAVVVLFVAGLSIGAGSIALAACTQPQPDTSNAPTPIEASRPAVGAWDTEQITNATTIIRAGAALHVPPRGWVIAVAVAIQESRLVNLGNLGAHNDHDSLGLFQQRPSQGWGTPTQILDPTYAANQFYRHLTALPSWQDLPLSEAGQRVQRSQYRDAYAKWEDDAVAIVQAVGPETSGLLADDFSTWLGTCAALGSDGLPDSASEALPAGFTLPAGTPPAVSTAIAWALRQLGTPYHFGGDCRDAHSGVAAHQCDCSSLVQQAYRAAGITIPRTTTGQVHAGTAITNLTQLRPGDLLFIPGSDGTRSAPRHVGVYLGSGLLEQAPHSGDSVKISKLAAWQSSISAIRRIV